MSRRIIPALLCAVASLAILSGCAQGEGTDSAEMMPAPADEKPMPSGETPVEQDREIIRNAQLSMAVDDVRAAVDDVTAIAVGKGGRVSSANVNSTGEATYADITARIPAADLDAAVESISALGTVENLTFTSEDVTAQGIDLDARIAALQTSITRLQELLAQATTTKDLIDIEGELTVRQAELDSLVAQRAALSEAVAMSTLSVYLSPRSVAAEFTPPGFLVGLESGWNALRTLTAALITAVGFLLPFAAVAIVIAIPIVVVVLLLRRRRR